MHATEVCPRCGLPYGPEEVVCPACGWLLRNQDVPPQYRMSSFRATAHPGDVSENHDQSSVPTSAMPSQGVVGNEKSRKRPRGFVSVRALIRTLVIVVPVAFLAGMAFFKGVSGSRPPVVVPGPTHFVTRTVRVPSPVQTITKTVRVPTFPVPSVSNADGASAAFPNVLRGGMVNNALRTTVWISIGPTGPFHSVTAEIDTGSVQTIVNGGLMQDFGDVPSGATEDLYGIDGSATVDYYDNIWVWAYPNGQGAPLIAGGVEPAGLGHSALGAEGVEIDLGQNVLAQGTLIQMQNAWQFQYQPQ